MQYLIFDYGPNEDRAVMMTRPAIKEDRDYLQTTVIPALRPLSEQDYCYGPAAILDTDACFSYLLDGENLLWCVEWYPGLLVIRFSPDGSMAWAAFRSPHPHFGGREGSEEEWENFDEEAHNPQSSLVFLPLDAETEPEKRDDKWAVANKKVQRRWATALLTVNKLALKLHAEIPTDKAREAWQKRCEKSPIWKGIG